MHMCSNEKKKEVDSFGYDERRLFVNDFCEPRGCCCFGPRGLQSKSAYKSADRTAKKTANRTAKRSADKRQGHVHFLLNHLFHFSCENKETNHSVKLPKLFL